MLISLFEWAHRHKIAYSEALRMMDKGLLEKAVRVGDRRFVPAETLPPERLLVQCMVCGEWMAQITPSHLRSHKMTLREYREKYPDALLRRMRERVFRGK